MDKILENLIEDAAKMSDKFFHLSLDMQLYGDSISKELDRCGKEIRKGLEDIRCVKKFFEEPYEMD